MLETEAKDAEGCPPLRLPSGTTVMRPAGETDQPPSSTLEREVSLLRVLADAAARRETARPLKLEPGAIPTLVCYGGDHAHRERYRRAAERTAEFHAGRGVGEPVRVLQVRKKEGDGEGGAVDDVENLSRSIYEWYDEVVA